MKCVCTTEDNNFGRNFQFVTFKELGESTDYLNVDPVSMQET